MLNVTIGLLSLFVLSLSVVINAEVSFVEQPSDTAVGAGETVVLKCRVTGSEPAAEIVSWIVVPDVGDAFVVGPANPVVDQDIANRYNITGDPTEGHYDLQITDVKESDAGSYRCLVTILASSSATLQVLSPRPPGDEYPRCYGDDINGAVYINQYVSVTCESKGGYPLPVLTWDKDGEAVNGVFTLTPYPKNVYHWGITENDNGKLLTCMAVSPEMMTPRMCTIGPLKVLSPSATPNPPTVTSTSTVPIQPSGTPSTHLRQAHGSTLGTTQNSNTYSVKIEPTVNDVSRDDDVMFTCLVLGGIERFDGRFSWKIDREPLQIRSDANRYRLENGNRTLRFKAKSSDDSAIVFCEISNRQDVMYASALIRVHGDGGNASNKVPSIIGMAVAAVVVIALFVIAFILFARYKRPKKKEHTLERENGIVVRSPDSTALGRAPLDAANEHELQDFDWKMFCDKGPDIMFRNQKGKTLYVYQNNGFPSESYS